MYKNRFIYIHQTFATAKVVKNNQLCKILAKKFYSAHI